MNPIMVDLVAHPFWVDSLIVVRKQSDNGAEITPAIHKYNNDIYRKGILRPH